VLFESDGIAARPTGNHHPADVAGEFLLAARTTHPKLHTLFVGKRIHSDPSFAKIASEQISVTFAKRLAILQRVHPAFRTIAALSLSVLHCAISWWSLVVRIDAFAHRTDGSGVLATMVVWVEEGAGAGAAGHGRPVAS
jgi:hypothetical protein